VQNTLVWWLAISTGLAAMPTRVMQEPPTDFSCVSFPTNLNEAVLVDRYGRDNVRRAPVWGSDDGPRDGVVVFDGSAKKLEAVWWDPGTNARLHWIRTREAGGPWQAPGGISIGLDLRMIERRNGRPFRLAGLAGPEGRGIIRSWGGGRLPDVEAQGCRVAISLQPSSETRVDPAAFARRQSGSIPRDGELPLLVPLGPGSVEHPEVSADVLERPFGNNPDRFA
jgi:hypothetical protein